MQTTLKQELKQKLHITHSLLQSIEILQASAGELEELILKELNENPLLELPERKKEGGFSGELSFVPNAQKDLSELLCEQIRQTEASPATRLIAEYLVDYVEESGYLNLDPKDEHLQKIPPEQIEMAIQLLQSLEPRGVGARNLQECLLLQLSTSPEDELLRDIIRDSLEEVASGHLQRLEEKYALTRAQLIHQIERLRALDPKPGYQFSSRQAQYIFADVEFVKGDPVEIRLSDIAYPELAVSREYDQYSENAEAGAYIHKKKTQANLFIKALAQRRETMFRICRKLIELQADFFYSDAPSMIFLTRAMLAEALELHNSTVSRAVQDKYFLWENAVHAFDVFFPKGVKRFDGRDISSTVIMNYLQELIRSEPPDKPFSDQKLTDKLSEAGVNISRRTVQKYREQLGYRRANQRRHYQEE